MGVALWGRSWLGRTIRCRCDNMAVVAILKSGSSKDERAMHLMRSLFFFLASYNVILLGKHIPGVENGGADALSRDNRPSFLTHSSRTNSDSTGARAGSGNQPTRLDISELARQLFSKGLAESTQRTYSCGQKKYLFVGLGVSRLYQQLRQSYAALWRQWPRQD